MKNPFKVKAKNERTMGRKVSSKTVDGYVFRDEAQRTQVKTWIKKTRLFPFVIPAEMLALVKQLPKLLFNELEVNDLDILEINASLTNRR